MRALPRARFASVRRQIAVLGLAAIIAGFATVAPVPVQKPVGATWCGFNGWSLTYHVQQSWWVVVDGYDTNGDWRAVRIYLPNLSNYDGNHCWAEHQTLTMWFEMYNGTVLSQRTKYLVTLCTEFGGIPLSCWARWSPAAQVYGP